MKHQSSVALLNELIEEYYDSDDDPHLVGARVQRHLIAMLLVEQKRTNELLTDLITQMRVI